MESKEKRLVLSGAFLTLALICLSLLLPSSGFGAEPDKTKQIPDLSISNGNFIPAWTGFGGYCTDWAYQRWQEVHPGEPLLVSGDAWMWYDSARNNGMSTGSTARQGAVAVFDTYYGLDSKYGHVAFVERVNVDGSFYVSEMNVCGRYCRSNHTYPAPNSHVHFIYSKDSGPPGPAPGSPVGEVDYVTSPGLGKVWVRGWDFDPNVPTQPLEVHVYVGAPSAAEGGEGFALRADGPRADVGATYPGVGNSHGFDATLTTSKRGVQPVYIYAINALGTPGGNVLLATTTVNIGSPDPVGAIDYVTSPEAGKVWVRGWDFDPDVPTQALEVHVYVGAPSAAEGGEGFALRADGPRADVGTIYPGVGNSHGFDKTLTTSKRGVQQVYVYAINAPGTPGGHVLLGTRTVNISNPDPTGVVDYITSPDPGKVWVRGWDFDPNVPTQALEVHVYVGAPSAAEGGEGFALRADGPRADVGAAYPGVGNSHGFDATLTTSKRGVQPVYIYAINAPGTPGGHVLLATATVNIAEPRHYYFTWYDNISSRSWILIANPSSASKNTSIGVHVAGASQSVGSLQGTGPGIVPKGSVLSNVLPGLMGGPVDVDTTYAAIVSQRILWGNSLEEVQGVEESRLSNHYWWPWYDQKSPGMKDWVLIANPGSTTVTYTLKIAGSQVATGTLKAGEKATPTFPNTIGGPVELTASGKVIASQRILSSSDRDFTEVPAIPDSELSDHYLWTWYDNNSAGATDWVLIANPGTSQVSYTIKIAGSTVGTGTIDPGQKVTPTFPNTMGGPLEVTANGKVICSQRVVWNSSFDELAGYPFSQLKSSYAWTWYDQKSPGSQNWVLIANPNSSAVTYEVKIAGAKVASGSINAGEKVTPSFPGTANGPVEVTASGTVMASQRVLWSGFFNEIVGG